MDDINKLLEIAESGDEKVRFANTEVEKFIHEMGIESGDTKVPTYTVYYHYYIWKKKRNAMSRVAFFRRFKPHFKQYHHGDTKGYLLNAEPFDLTTMGFFKARALLRRERDVRKRKKAQNKVE